MANLRPSKWQLVADRLGRRISISALDASVVDYVGGAAKGKWLVSVSGGADSIALLLLLWTHWPKKRRSLVAVHFDHALRGSESTGDARFCARVAKSLGVAFEQGKWADPPPDPSEARARNARSEFFGKVRRRYRGKVIWTGHQQDDVAESILMRLARGSGTSGLAAPRPIQRESTTRTVRLRPLLSLSREDLTAALQAAGGCWREDSSNTSKRHFRNRVRNDVIPAWMNAAERDAKAGAARSRRLLAEDDEALEAWVEEIAPFDETGCLRIKRLQHKPTAIWRRALHAWLLQQPDIGDLSRAGFEDLLGRVRQGAPTRFSLGRTGFARIRRGFLIFEQRFPS